MHCVKTRNFSSKYTAERMKGQQQIPRPNFQIMHLKRTSIQNIQKLSHLYKKKTKHPVKSVNKIGTDASGEPWVAKTIRKTTLLVIKETQMKTRRYHDAPTRTARMRKTDLLSAGEEGAAALQLGMQNVQSLGKQFHGSPNKQIPTV